MIFSLFAGIDILVQATKLLAKLLHQKEDLEEAVKCFITAFEKFPDNVDNDDVNLYLELLISLGWYNQALGVCCELCGVQFGGSSLPQVKSSLSHVTVLQV